MLIDTETIDGIKKEEYVVVLYWTKSQAPILNKKFATQEEAQQFHDSYKLKLEEIDKLIQNNDLENAEKTTKELIETSKAISQPVTEDQPSINIVNE